MVHFVWVIAAFLFGLAVGVTFITLSKYSVDEIIQEDGGDEDNL